MSSVKDAVRCAGGANASARACGVSVRAVYKWLAADSLPRTEYTGETDYVERLAAAAAANGSPFNAAELRESAAPRKSAA